MPTYRVVYDVTVPDDVPEAHVREIGQDMASNMRWGLVHDTGTYPQSLERPVIVYYGVKLLPAAPAA